MALTATANQAVVTDSMKAIQMRNPFLHTQSFNRPNLRYFVKPKDGTGKQKLMTQIATEVMQRKHQTGIIYCFSRRDTETVAEELISLIPSMRQQITFYHADLPQDVRESRQKKWSMGDIKIIW